MRSIAKSYWIAVAVMAAWLVVWIVFTWPSMMDDALIHLRFADHLWRLHIVSYDGVQRTYGTSSLLYIAILAVLRGLITASPVLPRAVSSVALVALFCALAIGLARRLRDAPVTASLLSLLLLAILVMPSSIRWLDDGMETGITLLLTALLTFAAWAYASNLRGTPLRGAIEMAALGLCITLLRVEMLLLLGVVSATILSVRRERGEPGGNSWFSLQVLLECMSPMVGGLLGAGLIVLLMHALLPDTALAKSFGLHAWTGTVTTTLKVFAGSMSFGLGSLLLWLLSWMAVVAAQRGLRLSSVIANSPFPVVLLLTVLHGQAVQGVRYFEWAMLYSILWNILELATTKEEIRADRLVVMSAVVLGAVLLVSAPVEAHLLSRLFQARENSLAEFRQQDLEKISGLRVVAFDVGYIGYFSEAPLCDMAGLVNGREAAMMTYQQRVTRCAAWKPQAGFLNRPQMRDFSNQYELKDWFICAEYDYANLSTIDAHFLIAAPAYAKQVCAAAHGTPRPVTELLQ